jgi:hypothetical protein
MVIKLRTLLINHSIRTSYCESTFIRGHSFSWFLLNALINRLLTLWFQTLKVTNQLKSCILLDFHFHDFSELLWNPQKLAHHEQIILSRYPISIAFWMVNFTVWERNLYSTVLRLWDLGTLYYRLFHCFQGLNDAECFKQRNSQYQFYKSFDSTQTSGTGQ